MGKFNITDGPARPVIRVIAGAMGTLSTIPMVFSLVSLCHTVAMRNFVEFFAWSYGPLWGFWIAFTGYLFPELPRRKDGR